MTIELTQEQERVIERQLSTGRFASKDEVISEALALLEQQDEVLTDVRDAYREAHKRNAQLEPDEARDRIGRDIREHRQSQH